MRQRFLRTACLVILEALLAEPVAPQSGGDAVGIGARIRVTTSANLSVEETLATMDLPMTAVTSVDAGTITIDRPNAAPMTLARAGTQLEGLLVEVTDWAIAVRVDRLAEPVTIVRKTIVRLERTSGYQSRARKAAYGAVIGAGAGALVGLAGGCESGWFCGAGIRAGGGAIAGAAAGTTIGAVLPPSARWITVPEASLAASADRADVPASQSRRMRVEISVGAGVASKGPASDIEEALRAAGFDDPSAGFGSLVAHPVSYNGFDAIGTPYWLDVRYTVREPWSVSFQYSRVPLGETWGFHAPFYYLIVDYEEWTAGGTLAWKRGPVSIGAGPALFRGRSRTMNGGIHSGWTSHFKPGVLAEAVLHIPEPTRVFFDARAQYRFSGDITVGPYRPFGWPADSAPPIPTTDMPFNHWFIAVGPGLRF